MDRPEMAEGEEPGSNILHFAPRRSKVMRDCLNGLSASTVHSTSLP